MCKHTGNSSFHCDSCDAKSIGTGTILAILIMIGAWAIFSNSPQENSAEHTLTKVWRVENNRGN